MITAIPMKEDRVASHFTKADSFVLLMKTEMFYPITKANPALNANCSGKKDLLAMLLAENAKRVIVRNIGEQFWANCSKASLLYFKRVVVDKMYRSW